MERRGPEPHLDAHPLRLVEGLFSSGPVRSWGQPTRAQSPGWRDATMGSTMRLALERIDQRFLALMFALPVVVATALAASGVSYLGLAALLAATFVWLLSRRVWLPFVAVLFVICSIYWVHAYPTVYFVGFRIYLSELVVVACLISLLFLPRPGMEIVGLLLSVFFIAVVGGVLVGSGSVGVKTSLIAARSTLFYATFWVALTAYQRRSVLFGVAVALAMLSVALQVGEMTGLHVIQAGTYANMVRTESTLGITRVRPPGLTLTYIVAAFAACYVFWGPRQRRFVAVGVFAVSMIGVILSYNRNMLLGLVLGLLVAGLIAKRRSRFVTGMIVLAIVAVVALQFASLAGPRAQSVAERFISAGNTATLRSASLAERGRENASAMRALSSSPVTGIGWGPSYDPVTPWIHNQYLGLWLNTGLLGLIVFVGALAVTWVRGVHWAHSSEPDDWLGAGVVTAITEIAFSALVGMYLTDVDSVVPLMGVLAIASGRALLTSQRQLAGLAGEASR